VDFAQALKTSDKTIDRISKLRQEPVARIPVLFAKIKLLWQCNLSCVYCSRPAAKDPLPRSLVTALLSDLAKQGLRKVHFSGGEVLLHPELFPILEDAAGLKLQVNLTTNGTLLSRDKIKNLSRSGVHSVSISLDSADPSAHDKLRGKKGAFKATVKTIRTIAENPKLNLRINTVVSSKNAGGLDDLQTFVSSLGSNVHWKIIPVDTMSKSLLLTPGLAAELAGKIAGWKNLDDQYAFGKEEAEFAAVAKGRYGFRRSRCYIPWVHLFVDPSGFCYPCCMTRGKVRAFGKYPEDSLEQILLGEAASNLKMTVASGALLPVCRHCDDFLEENGIIERIIGEQI
jgi:MoaA/NifB/PqqE/SkfB family radical SAM enzyme